MKTSLPKKEEMQRIWYIVDAKDKILGRLATAVAVKLRGKDKALFTPHLDCGDNVIVINAEKIQLTGKKLTDKKYYTHSGYPGGIKEKSAETMIAEKPTSVIKLAVTGMLPKNKLRRSIITKLKVYAGPEHPHTAQKPIELTI